MGRVLAIEVLNRSRVDVRRSRGEIPRVEADGVALQSGGHAKREESGASNSHAINQRTNAGRKTAGEWRYTEKKYCHFYYDE